MIAYADKTRIALGYEQAWGQAPEGGYTHLHINAESLMPQIRSLQPQQLSAALPRIRLEEMVAGEIETALTVSALGHFLPLVLHGSYQSLAFDIEEDAKDESTRSITVDAPYRSALSQGDQVWVSGQGEQNCGFYPIEKVGGIPRISGFADSDLTAASRCIFRRISAGSNIHSASMIRKYDDGGPWTRFNGMMTQRLVLDLEEDRPPLLAAAMLGQSQDRPDTVPEPVMPLPAETFDLSRHLVTLAFTDNLTGERIDTGNMVMTGLRLVLERAGMTPQFGLGAITPQVILPGRLQVNGSLSMLVSGQQFFNWLANQHRLAFTLQVASSRSGFSMMLPDVEITGVDGGASTADQPVRAVFHFTDTLADGQSGIRFFIKD